MLLKHANPENRTLDFEINFFILLSIIYLFSQFLNDQICKTLHSDRKLVIFFTPSNKCNDTRFTQNNIQLGEADLLTNATLETREKT